MTKEYILSNSIIRPDCKSEFDSHQINISFQDIILVPPFKS